MADDRSNENTPDADEPTLDGAAGGAEGADEKPAQDDDTAPDAPAPFGSEAQGQRLPPESEDFRGGEPTGGSEDITRSLSATPPPTAPSRRPSIPFQQGASVEVAGFPQIAGYQVTGRLGEGGMGTVWRAIQLSTRRAVALKLMSGAMLGSERARIRFEREVELAALVEHPHIARVYDSGLHQGVFFYAMELIDGLPLDYFIKSNACTKQNILGLMARVCEAVQVAHQRGVIHRDLKPSNILVTKDGQPHVLDFGLAKALQATEGAPELSMAGEVSGTPAYMSPEQARGEIDRIDTRSDVYSLGVILYRMLSGKSPHKLEGTQHQVLHRVATEPILRPRTADENIDRELEALLLKALAQDPDDRYDTAGEFGDDIVNYLEGRPLDARPHSTMYALRKWTQRYRTAVTLSIAALLALGIWSGYLFHQIVQQRDTARGAANVARKGINELIYDVHDLLAEQPGARPALESMLETALGNLDQLNAVMGEPTGRAEHAAAVAMRKRAELYLLTGRTDKATKLIERSYQMIHEVAAREPANLEVQRDLGVWQQVWGDLSQRAGKSEVALAHYREALKIRKQLAEAHPQDARLSADVAETHEFLGDIEAAAGNTTGALEHYIASRDLRAALVDADPQNLRIKRELSDSLSKLGEMSRVTGDINAELDYYRQSLQIFAELAARNEFGVEEQRNLAVAHNRMGSVSRRMGQIAEAKDHFLRSLRIIERLVGYDPDDAVARTEQATCLLSLGYVTDRLGDTAAAAEYYRQAVEIRIELSDADAANMQLKRELADAYQMLGDVKRRLNQTAEAIDYLTKSATIRQQIAAIKEAAGDVDIQRDLSISYDLLGDVNRQLNDRSAARRHYQQALAIRQKIVEADAKNVEARRDLLISYNRLAAVSDPKEAIDWYLKALAQRQTLSDADPANAELKQDLAVSHNALAAQYQKIEDATAALTHLQQAVAIHRELAAADPLNSAAQHRLAVARHALGNLLVSLNNPVEAISQYEQSMTIFEQLVAQNPQDARTQSELIVNLINLAEAHAGRRQYDQAIERHRGALKRIDALEAAGRLSEEQRGWAAFVQQKISQYETASRTPNKQ